jgi:hypothetical protein
VPFPGNATGAAGPGGHGFSLSIFGAALGAFVLMISGWGRRLRPSSDPDWSSAPNMLLEVPG